VLAALLGCAIATAAPIDRHALVTRHNPHLTRLDPAAPLSVGNGEFAFTVDVTGLQTFTDYYRDHGIATETQARWSWHEDPNPGYTLADANAPYQAYGRTVPYPTRTDTSAANWLRQNPQIQPLPQISLTLEAGAGPLTPKAIAAVDQTLDLWSGTITSRYTLDGQPITVVVACAPDADTIAVRIDSGLLAKGRLGVSLAFPRGYDMAVKNNAPLDWSWPLTHNTRRVSETGRRVVFEHTRHKAQYYCAVTGDQPFDLQETKVHEYRLTARAGTSLAFTMAFSPADDPREYSTEEVLQASAAAWPRFWGSGGAIEFAGSKDPRAAELERRVVLSQYLTAIQCAAGFPPQESGLTLSTWYGKHHTEMIWWHAAHFALWGRDGLLERNLEWFRANEPVARDIAAERGLRGARWPKMIGPTGRESPGGNPLIVWNEPHVIHLAELLYRNRPTAEIVAKYRDLVLETADCLASMLHWNAQQQRYDLGPPLWISQEIYDPATSVNPCYELSYWSTALQIAQRWRERSGLPRDEEWDRIVRALAPLPTKDGLYVALASHPDTWKNPASRQDHPSFLMALGQLPGDGVDRPTMARTLDAVIKRWDWKTKIWGWDYPMVAMTAARLEQPQLAVDLLLKSDGANNVYTAAGHNRQQGDLPVYLPGNGALLAAVAMMAAGWDGAPAGEAPGFPRDGNWVVHAEGLHRLP
jgi:hypothetical protein